MKKIRIFALALLLLLLALAFASCEFETASPTPGNDAASTTNTTTATTATTDTEESDPIPKNQEAKLVSAEGFTVNENTLSLSVPNATASYSFLNKITVSEGATWSVCLDEFGLQHSLTKTVPLEIGDNTFYLIVSAKNDETISVYPVSIRRRPIYTVTFNTAGGNAVDPAQVEEDGVIVPPVDPTRTCHAFAGWDVDLALPVTGDLTVTANWTAEHTWSTEYTVDREQTCTVPGSKSYHCTRCGAKDPASVTEIPAEHSWNPEYTIDTPATCARVGSKSIHCVKCGTQKPGSVERIDKLAHTESADYIVDVEPNCTENGYKSKHCTVCGAIIDSTIETLDADESRHNVENWTVTTPATLLNQTGARTGECTICHNPVNEVLTFEPTVLVCTDTSSAGYATDGVAFSDILGDKHFYPTDEDPTGNDLLIEYSVLWNETMLDLYDTRNFDPYITARINKEPVLLWSPMNNMDYSDCKYAGGFEWMGNFSTPISDAEVTTPATMCGVNPNYSDYPNIGGADQANPEWGWHRIQVRVHQELRDEAAVKTGAAGGDAKDYVATVTVYIDGVAAFKLFTGTKGLQKIEDNLFTADADGNGGITYTDGNASVVAFNINRRKAVADKTAYVVIADINVTCGKDFVQRVEKAVDPEDGLFEVADGVELNAPIYYRLVEN